MKKICLLLFILSLIMLTSSCDNKDKSSDEAQYIVKYSSNGGSEVTQFKGNVITEQPITTKEGYSFKGWHEKNDFSDSKITFPYILTKDIILYANWIKNTDGLSFSLDGSGYSVSVGIAINEIEIAIPNTYNGKPVQKIKKYAFANCNNLVSLVIPNSVLSIEESAIFNCGNLTSITLPFIGSQRGNEGTFESLFGYIFGTNSYTGGISTEQWYTMELSKTYYIPEKLTSVIITAETSVAFGALMSCNKITNIELPNSITKIGIGAFGDCKDLVNINIPEGVTIIEQYSFRDCNNLSNIIFPSSLKSIGMAAFYACWNLTNISIPEGVISIGDGAFYWCSRLTDIKVNINNSFYSSKNGVLLNKDQTALIQYPSGKDDFEYTILNSVLSINIGAFGYCSNLKNIVIPNSVETIGVEAFVGCSNLAYIVIPSSVKNLGEYAFLYCQKLTINCEATSQPSGWDRWWNQGNRPVVWGYTK